MRNLVFYNDSNRMADWMHSLPGYKDELEISEGTLGKFKGGPGSGHFGHSGRPGKRGGSQPQGHWIGNESSDEESARAETNAVIGLRKRGQRYKQAFLDEVRRNPEFKRRQAIVKAAEEEFFKASDKHLLKVEEIELDIDRHTRIIEAGHEKIEELIKKQNEVDKKYSEALNDFNNVNNEVVNRSKKQLTSIRKQLEATYKSLEKSKDAREELKKELDEIVSGVKKNNEAYKAACDEHGDALLEIAKKSAEKYRTKVTAGPGGKLKKITESQKKELADIEKEMLELTIKRSESMKNGEPAQERQKIAQAQIDLQKRAERLTQGVTLIDNLKREMMLGYMDIDSECRAITRHPADFPPALLESVLSGRQQFNLLVSQNNFMQDDAIKFGYTSPDDEYGGTRAYAGGGLISVPKAGYLPPSTVVHEMGHILEERDYMVGSLAKKFLKRRTAGLSQEKLRVITGNKNYKENEEAIKDGFEDAYSGKIYGSLNGHLYATEIMSMGLQKMSQNPGNFAMADPDYFDFVYSVSRLGGI